MAKNVMTMDIAIDLVIFPYVDVGRVTREMVNPVKVK